MHPAQVGKVAPELAHLHPQVLRHDAVFTLLRSMHENLETLTPEDSKPKAQQRELVLENDKYIHQGVNVGYD